STDVDLDASAPGKGYATTFIANGAAVSIAETDITITDSDSAMLASATITLTNAQAGDILAVGTLPAGITASVVGNVVTLTGAASPADYQAAIRAVTFSNSSDFPNTVTRVINVVVSDGTYSSAPVTTTVDISTVDDAPIIDLNGPAA